MKTNLKALYEACQLAFTSNDDKIMADALKAFEAELKAKRTELAKRGYDGIDLVIIDEILGDDLPITPPKRG